MQRKNEKHKEILNKFIGTLSKNEQLLQIQKNVKQIIINLLNNYQNLNVAIPQFLKSTDFQQFITNITKFQFKYPLRNHLQKFFNSKNILYEHLFGDKYFSIILIFLPEGIQFSLHDHPNLLAIAKLLQGQLQIECMDLKQKQKSQKNQKIQQNQLLQNNSMKNITNKFAQVRIENDQIIYNQVLKKQKIQSLKQIEKKNQLAREQTQDIFEISNWKKLVLKNNQFSITRPNQSNIHKIKALKNSIFIDILIPNYQSQDSISYYEYVNSEKGNISNRKLKKIMTPKETNKIVIIYDYLNTK